MRITIDIEFDSSMTPKAVEFSRQELRDIVEAAVSRSDLLPRIMSDTGDHPTDGPACFIR